MADKEKHLRLYSKGVILGHKRGLHLVYPNTTLLKIQGVNTREDTNYYLGKRVAYVYRGKKKIKDSRVRIIWGKITRHHGDNGAVRAKFRSNIPPKAFGAPVRVFLYPSRV